MTITHSYTKLVAVAAGVAVAFALVLGAAAPVRAAALTSGQISSIIGLLQSFGADAATIANVQASLNGTAPTMPTTPSTGGSMACKGSVWARDLTVGATGADVMALQKFLNMSAATQVAATGAGSPGMETSTFGPATRAAVIKFQTANAITPAAGYVGPITRTTIAAKCSGTTPTTPGTPTTPTTPTTPVGLTGGEGQIHDIDSLGDVDTSVDEGDSDVKVLGVEFKAKNSDVSVQRVDVDVKTHSGDGSSRLTNYVDSVSLWLDGKKLATIDASDITKDSSNVYSFRFTGINGVVREDKKANMYVSFDVVSNMDSTDDADTWVVNIPQDGIRAVDAAGISDTYVTSANSTTLTETVTFNTADSGTMSLAEGNDNPLAGLVTVSSTTETKKVKLLEINVKAKSSSLTIHDFPIGVAVSGASNVSGIVKRVRLMHGSTVLGTETASTGTYNAITFDNVDFDIDEGDTETFSVEADIADADSGEPDNGDTLVASTTGALAGWDVEDAKGDTLTESTGITGSVAGNTQNFFTGQGIIVAFQSATATKTIGPLAGSPDVADFTIKFSVKNLGDDTIYFDGDITAAAAAAAGNGVTWATTTDSTTGTTTGGGTYGYGTAIVSAVNVDSGPTADVLNSGDKRFPVGSGQPRDFTFMVSIPAGGDNVNAGVKLTGFAWDTTSQDAMTNFYNFDLGLFNTNTLQGLVIQ